MNDQNERGYVSEISPARKRKIFLWLFAYGVGFLLLWSIGSAINENGYLLRALFASLTFLLVLIFLPYALYKSRRKK